MAKYKGVNISDKVRKIYITESVSDDNRQLIELQVENMKKMFTGFIDIDDRLTREAVSTRTVAIEPHNSWSGEPKVYE